MILKGIRWRVGNSNQINIWSDLWIPHHTSFKLVYYQPSSLAMVSNLMLARGIWNERLIDDMFLPLDSEAITFIPLSINDKWDATIWHHDKQEDYTVWSSYNVLLAEQLSLTSSSHSLITKWWKNLRKLHIPHKICVFIWRVIHETILTRTRQADRKMAIDIGCEACGRVESISHVLFEYRWAWEVRKANGFWEILKSTLHIYARKVILGLFWRSTKY